MDSLLAYILFGFIVGVVLSCVNISLQERPITFTIISLTAIILFDQLVKHV
jgi:membrane protein implicated in regulation of membrane protease activity